MKDILRDIERLKNIHSDEHPSNYGHNVIVTQATAIKFQRIFIKIVFLSCNSYYRSKI